MSSMHYFCWEIGLKTGMYYLKTKPAAQAIQFTVEKSKVKETFSAKKEKETRRLWPQRGDKNMETRVGSIQNRDECFS